MAVTPTNGCTVFKVHGFDTPDSGLNDDSGEMTAGHWHMSRSVLEIPQAWPGNSGPDGRVVLVSSRACSSIESVGKGWLPISGANNVGCRLKASAAVFCLPGMCTIRNG